MGFCDSSVGKEFTAMQHTMVWFLGWENLLQKGQTTHPTILGLPLWLNWLKKKSACNAGELGLIPRLGRAPGEGKGYPLQYSGLENSMNRNHGVTKNQTRLSNFHFQGLNILGSYAILFLQHQTLLSPPDTSTTGYHFCFGSASSFLLELFLCFSPVTHWTPTDLGSSSFSVISFCLFILFMGFSRHECWSVLPFPSPVGHVLWELSTMTCPSWVTLHAMAHSFIKLHKAVIHVIILVSFLWFWFSFCLPSDEWGWEAYASFLMGGTCCGNTGSCSGGKGHTQ